MVKKEKKQIKLTKTAGLKKKEIKKEKKDKIAAKKLLLKAAAILKRAKAAAMHVKTKVMKALRMKKVHTSAKALK